MSDDELRGHAAKHGRCPVCWTGPLAEPAEMQAEWARLSGKLRATRVVAVAATVAAGLTATSLVVTGTYHGDWLPLAAWALITLLATWRAVQLGGRR